MNKSLWMDEPVIPQFKALEGDIKTDVLVIGGGLCGLLCAYYLKNSGIDCIVAEAETIGNGTTKNTTAKITYAHGFVYDKLIKSKGLETARLYAKANSDALDTYKELLKTMDTDIETKSLVTYSLTDSKKAENEAKAMQKVGLDASFCTTEELPFATAGAVESKKQMQINPIKFISQISAKLNIYEHTFIKEIKPDGAKYDKGTIKADKIIVATHFPFINSHGMYFAKLYQHRSYVSAYEGIKGLDAMYVDESLKGMSFRTHGDLTLIGGGGHRTGKKGSSWNEIASFVKQYYPQATLKYSFAAQDCMSLDHIPYIGNYSKNTPNLYVATGFNKWGFTSSMVAAKILCDEITGKKNEYAKIFSPQRSMLSPQLFANGLETTINLLTPTQKRCSHMGCALKWNKFEHTWDCPCHGSRFEADGSIIDNPSTKNLNT